MAKVRSWTDAQLIDAVASSKSYRVVLIKLNLVPAGGNYEHVKRAIKKLKIPTNHFKGQGWNEG
jgi:hypothetical protein